MVTADSRITCLLTIVEQYLLDAFSDVLSNGYNGQGVWHMAGGNDVCGREKSSGGGPTVQCLEGSRLVLEKFQ
jgi:hypothetical protein